GDLDGDGDLDLYLGVTGGAFADEIWLNDGSGSFTNSGQALGSAFTSGVTLGDVDGDGDLDAVAANLGAGRQHAVWINQGGSQGGSAGVFAGSGQTTLTGATLDVELGDLDGDGDLDAFLPVYYQAGPNRIWLNDGGAQGGTPGQFSDAGLALGSAHSYGGALDDVDADGDLDLFTANYGNGTVAEPNRVWLNQPVAPPTPTPLPTPLPAGAEGWQRQLVATRGVTGLYTELALDSSGRPHVLFVRQEPTDPARPFRIVLAGWDGIRWQEQVIAAAADLGDEPILGLALDSQDRPAVVFQAQLDASGFPSYWVARWDGAAWQRDFLHYGDDDKPHAALAFGSNDRPHVTFATFDSLVYAYWDGAAWQQEDVADNFSGRNSSLAVDTHGQPHVSYRDRDRHLWYAYRDGGGWHRQPVDPAQPQPGAGTALVLDAADTPHIAYLEGNAFQPTALRVASRQGAGWAIAAVDTAVGVYAPTLALALDPQQRPHVLVVEDPGNDAPTRLLHHAWDGSAWQKEQLDPGGDSPSWPALAFDAAGRLHASYHYRRYDDLVYLAWDRFWQTRDVGGGGPAVGPALAMNGDGPGVSFYDVADGRLHVSQWQDGAWQANPAAFLGNPPADSSLFMSGATPSLSYYDADGQRLLFSQWDGAAWQTQVVDDTGDVGRYNDLFGVNLAGLGTHITYWDATTHRVKFAHIHADGSVTRHTNVAGPPLDAGSGHLSGGWLPGGHVVVSYYDGVRGDLRLATWDRTSGAWTDERVDGAAADVGQFSTLRVDAHDGVPVVAYYDATNQAIKLAYRHGGGWQTQVAVPAAGAVQSVALELGYGARDHARITYVDPAGDRLLIALLET
ncbi:MAG: VCBS repeat-containing protein, partial [Anaerolineales bacterium]|nr:VCBS repeat-containing protein [Anaerolineales bacterium]